MTSPSGPSRRQVLVAAAAAATAPLIAAAPAQAAGAARPRTWDLTLLGTSDTHGNVYNWDYYRDAEYDDSKQNDIGVAKLATLINQIRRERRGKATLVLDAGDTIQGTPAGDVLRQAGADHRHRGEAPDGPGDERHRLRRGDAGQPRVQLRPAVAGPVDPPARLPGARRQRGQREDRQAGLPAVRHQEGLPRFRRADPAGRHPGVDQPRCGHLGQGQRRGQAALRRHDRDRREVGADHAGPRRGPRADLRARR